MWRRCGSLLKDDDQVPLLDVTSIIGTAWSYAKECLLGNRDPRLKLPGSYTFIVNGFFIGINSLAGVGWICMDSHHIICEAISHPIRSSSCLETELMAILAVSEALNSYNSGGPIRILSDCENAVEIVKGVTRPPPQFIDLVKLIRENLSKSVKVEVVSVCESFTTSAHNLAKLATSTGSSQCWKDVLPNYLIDSVINSFD
ncbi:hypothetical protein J5N97_028132 [Dioscorea zingiberensis]|uniref:RNase H type-1 domain-containing protein n=1 Tax=Dioscorea zingiberensis TaxID=325984 RepID=A0A9D5BYK2_9LILI|nr:hypothetical protein J5N97_028132 [Dioscorea zingiberensis]